MLLALLNPWVKNTAILLITAPIEFTTPETIASIVLITPVTTADIAENTPIATPAIPANKPTTICIAVATTEISTAPICNITLKAGIREVANCTTRLIMTASVCKIGASAGVSIVTICIKLLKAILKILPKSSELQNELKAFMISPNIWLICPKLIPLIICPTTPATFPAREIMPFNAPAIPFVSPSPPIPLNA